MPDTPDPASDDPAIRRAMEVRDFLAATFPRADWVVVVEAPDLHEVFTSLPPDELTDLLRDVADSHPTDTTVLVPVPPAQ